MTPADRADLLLPSASALPSHPHVVVGDIGRRAVREKLAAIIDGGHGRLAIVADWDMTITRHHLPSTSTRQQGAIGILLRTSRRPGEYARKADELRDMYRPFEVDPTLNREEKEEHMTAWWTSMHSVLVSMRLLRREIPLTVHDAFPVLRDGVDVWLDHASKSDVPVVVVSAAVGDVIHEILHQANLLTPNVHIVSNWMEFSDESEDAHLVGFKPPLIHVFNKSSSTTLPAATHSRPNIILVGDSLGDVDMVPLPTSTSPAPLVVLRVGLLNHDIDTLLPFYTKVYDVVVKGDVSFDVWFNQVVEEACR
ncbi:hypothetical protein HDU93_000946 [Gonapodya sp. JEL0774]|nr:hypothetical protein HDU93_000946 [Gonapodya sp. JEL0774]